MGLTFAIPIFENEPIAKNASIVSGILPAFRSGPGDKFHCDLSASGGGAVSVHYLVGNTPDDDFIQPGTASNIGLSRSSIGTASRDHHPAFTPLLSQWIRFKAKELGASPVTFSFNLIVSR